MRPDPGYESWRKRNTLLRLRALYEPYIDAHGEILDEVAEKMTRELLSQQTLITPAECEELEAWFKLGDNDGQDDS